MCLPYSATPSNYAFCDGWQRLIRRSTPANGDGQWPNPGISGCPSDLQSDVVALSLITVVRRGTSVRERRATPAVS